jgi:signal transduction histidine kinase/DNA-binding response OmpR family regulator
MKTSTLLCLMLLLSHDVFSSNQNSNDFWESINIFKSKENKLKILQDLANDCITQGNPQKALQYANEGLILSLKKNAQVHVSIFYSLLGDAYYSSNLWDSAYIFYSKSKTIAEKINSKDYIANAYRNIAKLKIDQSKIDEVMLNSSKALKIYTETNNQKGIAYTYSLLAARYMQSGEIKTAFDYFFKSNKIINDLGGDPLLYKNYLIMGEVHLNLGNCDSSFYYLNQVIEYGQHIEKANIAFANSLLGELNLNYGNYTKAMEYQLKALAINEKNKHKKGIAIAYSGIGSLFEAKNDYKLAIKYYLKCLALAKEIKVDLGIQLCLNHLGYNYYKMKDYEIAKKYLLEGLLLAKKIQMPTEIGGSLNYLGLLYFEQKQYALAMNSYLECLNLYQKCGFKSGIAQTYSNIGKYYQHFFEFKKAIKNYNEALQVTKEIKSKEGIASLLLSLSECYGELSMFKQSNEYLRKYNSINDSLKSENHTKRITQLEMEYEFDKKQKEQQYAQKQKEQVLHAKIKNQKILIFSTISLITSLLLLLLFAFRNYHLKQKNIRKDIELHRLEAEKKREVDQMKLHFFANASHDIRTPLTLIMAPLKELRNSKGMPPQMYENIDMVYRNANLLSRFVDQILDFQQLDSHAISLSLTQNDIVSFAKNITEAFNYYVENKKCKIDFSCEFKELNMYFDAEKVEKILYNLIFNAIKFTPANGTITIKISADEAKAYITVKDNGVGIPADHLDLIFERYHQVEKTRAFYMGGSGIGLAHTKELIKIHKGDITVKSTEMKGSEFKVVLPRNINFYKAEEVNMQLEEVKRDSALKPTAAEIIRMPNISSDKTINLQEPIEPISYLNKPSVLIIEDDLDMHHYMVRCLGSQYNVYEAYNGTEGYNIAIKNNPDIIISDVMMENMDGIELCHKIKTELQVCHIPIILLTALAAIENKIAGFETGADDYITKPFDSDLLLARVQNIIESRRLLKEIFSRSIVIEPQRITANSIDEEFLSKAINIVEENMADNNFDVNALCGKMHVSRSVFYRKIKALTNQSSNDFIKSIRLKHAAQLLKSSDYPIIQIAYEVGFADQKYFSTCFRKYFNQSPSDYAQKKFLS